MVLGALLTGSLVLAGPGGFGGGDCNGQGRGQGTMTYEQHEERMEQRVEMMSTVLDLTEDQQQQVEALLNQQWQVKQQFRDQTMASRDALREARSSDNFDENDFRTKAAKHSELKTERMVQRIKMQQELLALFTPEQQEKAEKLGGMIGGKDHKNGRHGFKI